ncbi:hypothetical protein CERSUDRAFT_111417 [Gelatoporia subvermispora B]|uniref:Uncharacterized protein n=1 Tax=Ceriporiopsis subvermispora (strain B) TaxID=914234 RepID=M2QUT3_CERS8|nr:hypothetical protein CERSUDRAFT_111417 [Gelatoporia subvermispora B]
MYTTVAASRRRCWRYEQMRNSTSGNHRKICILSLRTLKGVGHGNNSVTGENPISFHFGRDGGGGGGGGRG